MNDASPPAGSSIVDALRRDPLFARAGYQSLARLLPQITLMAVKQGTAVARCGAPAHYLFLVLAGRVEVEGEERRRCGDEAATALEHYRQDAVALSDASLIAISRQGMARLLAENPALRPDFYQSLVGHQDAEPSLEAPPAPGATTSDWPALLGWLLALLAPAAVLYWGRDWGLERNALYFLAIFSVTVVMWVFTLVDEYLPGIFALLATLAMGLVPMPVILGGLASDGFFLAMSMLGLAAVVVSSGLSYRLLLLLLLKLPNTPFWQNAGLLFTGFALTPVVPSINGRVALVTPFMKDMAEILHLPNRGPAATRLAVSAFTGASLLSAVFLSSKSVNFVVFGLLPDQVKEELQWLHWAMAGAGTGLILLILYFLMTALLLRGGEPSHVSKNQVSTQIALLGPMRRREWAALLGIGLFIGGVATAALHQVQPPWLSLAVLYGLLLFGTLSKKEFQQRIDWPFLFYLAGIVGITAAFSHLGLDRLIAARLPWLGEIMRSSFPLFILALAGVIFIIRLAVPISATIVILATVFMPVAEAYGVNSWIVGFLILVLGEMWFFPYQCSYYLQFRQLTHHCESFDERRFLLFNALGNGARLAALYLSIPYWKLLGLL
ncbi:SLC13 family permease [Denitratisoma oestradiolicum]|uniref:Cyclic nucleotide-binding domain-containing protein n=1 Tax=Denitratisoma oestradiolicum TaxID=311182 RepID=A0A6S6YBY9_9PROT|nr:SLC13 family permease [Denitratisoma oestradiolicum]CAB1370166.1 conserved membrane protein of unknown function [Denitratisoma oestradiolicum]